MKSHGYMLNCNDNMEKDGCMDNRSQVNVGKFSLSARKLLPSNLEEERYLFCSNMYKKMISYQKEVY